MIPVVMVVCGWVLNVLGYGLHNGIISGIGFFLGITGAYSFGYLKGMKDE